MIFKFLNLFLAIFIVTFFLIIPLTQIYATDSTPQASLKFSVNHLSGPLEKLQEKITAFFKFSKEDKLDYQRQILEKRLAELDFVVNSSEKDPLETSASRYTTYVDKLTDYSTQNNITDRKELLISDYQRHLKVIEQLSSKFEANSGWWLALQHDKNTLQMSLDKIKSLKK